MGRVKSYKVTIPNLNDDQLMAVEDVLLSVGVHYTVKKEMVKQIVS